MRVIVSPTQVVAGDVINTVHVADLQPAPQCMK
jgi:hypothetical protein